MVIIALQMKAMQALPYWLCQNFFSHPPVSVIQSWDFIYFYAM